MTDSAQQTFVERMGLVAEGDGLPRIGGRLFGLLMLSEAPRSLDDLADALGVSKASISTDARRLLEHGIVERVGRPGDRRDYYRIAPDFFRRLIERRLARWALFGSLVRDCRAQLGGEAPTIARRFDEVLTVEERVTRAMAEALAASDVAAPAASARPARARRPRRTPR